MKNIYQELVLIRKELQTIRSRLEHRETRMSDAEILYRSLTEKERRGAGGNHHVKKIR